MKFFYTILFILTCPLYAISQSLHINTTRFVGGNGTCGPAESRYSIPTKDGGVLFVGITTCYAGGGDIPANFADAASSEGGNVLVGKLDSNLNISWVKVYGGTQIDIGMGAVQIPDGGYAVLAYTQSSDIDVSGNHGTGDIWLIRLDSLGNLLWQKCYGSPADEQPGSIALTPDNGFILLGVSNGSGGDVPTHYSGSQFDYDWFVVKTDSLGNKQWVKSIGGTGDEESRASIIAANNAYYLVSSSNSTNYDCTDTVWHHNVNTSYDYYIFKLDTAAGNILWDSSYGGGADELYQAIWDSRDSSIVINGSSSSFDYMVMGNHGGSDMWVIKTDKNGAFKWGRCLGSLNNESGNSICSTGFGYIVYGATDPGIIRLTDNWVFALDNFGDTLCNKQFGGTSYENPYTIIPFKNGFAATGASSSPGFTEGINLGPLTGAIEDVFVSYINYWPLSVNNISRNVQQLFIYPNPVQNNITIVLPDNKGFITVFSSIGQIIYWEQIKEQAYSHINTEQWANGIYIAKWQGENGIVLTKKFIKN